MKAAIFFMFLFNLYAVNAQLFISPSTKSDHYLYVRDRVLYVEKDIHLIENKSKETQANIYLRKSSQLIQGEVQKNTNSGTGSLSVFQTGTSNAYNYNYWALPVFLNINNPELRDYIYEPLTNINSRNAKLIAALDGSSDPLSISKRWIYSFSGNSYHDWHYEGDHFKLSPGQGFTMKGVNGTNLTLVEDEPVNKGASHIYDFRGTPNNGIIELNIKMDELLLVGNPYPSALDLNKFLIENTNTTGIAYFWDSRKNGNSHYLSDYEGGYGTYSAGTGIYMPPAFIKYSDGSETGELGSDYNRSRLPIAQGFIIKGKYDGKIKFHNGQRLFQKESKGVSEFKSSEPRLQSLVLSIEFDSTYVRKLALAFSEASTTGEDHAFDARQLNILPKDASWKIDKEDYNINVRPKIQEELIPLMLQLDREAIVKFRISKWENFNPFRLFIYDSREQLYFGIKDGDLQIKLPTGKYEDRFYLSFIEQSPPTETENPGEIESLKPPNKLLNTIDIFQNNPKNQLEVRLLYEAHIKNIKLYNLNGKLIHSQELKEKTKDFNFNTGNLSNAIYIVKVHTTDNIELTKKIGIKN